VKKRVREFYSLHWTRRLPTNAGRCHFCRLMIFLHLLGDIPIETEGDFVHLVRLAGVHYCYLY